ncbi:hypothetical protein [Nocardia amikacinitolerans]|uniref:hypothetical protein n=1 Tax=Nocardia amikacinitolerans TaxID=756689 RepID=UPI003557CB40|nr:hypothetical protein [Nocardia amikacinitolerans]
MTAMWFGLAAIALVGAIVLLYFDRVQRQRTGHARQVWAKAQGYTYVSVEPALPSTWRRGALAKLGYLSAVDVVSGIRKGEKFVLFDLEDAATLVAVRRQIGSDIDVDMRLKTASPPKDADLELLGAIGDRVVFATNPEIARHAVDQRMVAFIETLPDTVQMLWSEGNWTLGMLNVGTAAKDWESAIDAVLRLSGLLHVLPPVSDPRGTNKSEHDPGRPHPRTRDRAEEARSEPVRGASRVLPPGADDDRDFDDDEPRYDEDYEPDEREPAGEQSRRPSLAVVPDARARTREDRWSDDEADDDWRPESRRGDDWDDEPPASRADEQDRPGGPFHPGFRPYQGPVPQ